MKEVSSVFISGKLPSINEYIDACRRNRYQAAKMKRDAEALVGYQAARLSKINSLVTIRFTWYESSRKRDPDNVCAAKKFVLDALQKCGKLPNDNSHYIRGFEDAFVYGKCQGVMIEILVDRIAKEDEDDKR